MRMPDIDDRLRELLERKAAEVPPHGDLPSRLARRARRRAGLTTAGVGLAVVVLAGGTLVGLRALSRPNAEPIVPATGASGPSSSPSPSLGEIAACGSGQLRATVADSEGAMGSRYFTIVVTDVSDTTCTLQGTPAITLLDGNLNAITSGVEFGSAPAGWQANALPKPPGWPVVKLRPGDVANVRVQWSNWCPQDRAAPTWQLAVPGDGSVDVSGSELQPPPPCNGAGQPSSVEVGPFEPPISGSARASGASGASGASA
jgi:Protein of unknown function (DUF4232)